MLLNILFIYGMKYEEKSFQLVFLLHDVIKIKDGNKLINHVLLLDESMR